MKEAFRDAGVEKFTAIQCFSERMIPWRIRLSSHMGGRREVKGSQTETSLDTNRGGVQ